MEALLLIPSVLGASFLAVASFARRGRDSPIPRKGLSPDEEEADGGGDDKCEKGSPADITPEVWECREGFGLLYSSSKGSSSKGLLWLVASCAAWL